MVTILFLIRSSKKCTFLLSCVRSATFGKYRWRTLSRASACVSGTKVPVAPAALRTPRAKGTVPSRLSSFRLHGSYIAQSLLSISPDAIWRILRHFNVVSAIRIHFPAQHHGVVLVNHVMAVQRVAAQPVAEAEEEFHAFVRMQLHNVFA